MPKYEKLSNFVRCEEDSNWRMQNIETQTVFLEEHASYVIGAAIAALANLYAHECLR